MAPVLNNRFALIAFVSLASALLLVAFLLINKNSPGKLILHFRATVDSEPLVFNQIQYHNPGGDGEFKITTFQFYISNVKLVSESGKYSEPESYHLARFDNEKQIYSITLEDVPRQAYEKIEFSIGVDKVANNSVVFIGDLDPNSRTAWSWEVGYKFILFEGVIELNDTLIPLAYHVGFDENYKAIAFNLDQPLFGQREVSVDFNVDIMKLFTGTTVVNMAALPSVKFDKADARLIANNYESMLTLSAK